MAVRMASSTAPSPPPAGSLSWPAARWLSRSTSAATSARRSRKSPPFRPRPRPPPRHLAGRASLADRLVDPHDLLGQGGEAPVIGDLPARLLQCHWRPQLDRL